MTGENEDNSMSGSSNSKKENKIKIQAHDLQVSAQFTEANFEQVMNQCSEEMENLMKMSMAGEYQVLEKEELHSLLIGGE